MQPSDMTLEANLPTRDKSGCVVGTLVDTDKSIVPIQDIQVGDRVLLRPEWGRRK